MCAATGRHTIGSGMRIDPATVVKAVEKGSALLTKVPLPPREVLAVVRWVVDHGDELVAALDRYDDAWPGGGAARSAVEAAATEEACRTGHLSEETLQNIVRWGYGRGLKDVSDRQVRSVTAAAFKLREAGDQTAAIKKLCELKGVGPSTASKILALTDAESSAIFDSRVASALRDLRGTNGEPLLPTPPGRVVQGTGSAEEIAAAYSNYLLILRLMVLVARLIPRFRRLSSIENVEKALFVLGRNTPAAA